MDKKCDIKVKATGEVIRGVINVSLDGGEALYSVGIGGRTYKGINVDVLKCYDETSEDANESMRGFNLYGLIGIVVVVMFIYFAYKLIVRANQHSIWALLATIMLIYFLIRKIQYV